MEKEFPKIIFIIGFPRSGTKLLLQILKTNSKIGGSDSEVNIAHKVSNDPSHKLRLDVVFNTNTISENLKDLSQEELFHTITDKKCNVVNYKKLLVNMNRKPNVAYIVDKSPRYINHIDNLIQTFPDAKFIHIVRNPINVVLSHKKVWNKSIIRTSDQWRKVNQKLLKPEYQARILRIFYEDLTTNPNNSLIEISSYLNIPNDFNYKNVNSREKYGNVTVQGVKVNRNLRLSSNRTFRLIEEYSYNTMKAFGYKIRFAKKQKKKTLFLSILLIIWDKINVLSFHIKEKGILKGTRYYIKLQNK